jgi:DNA-directed RNA polymerase specialized sigma24 family protein
MSAGDASVTKWLRKLEAGQDDAAQQLWDVFFHRLVLLVQNRMSRAPQGLSDAEDVALSAFASFCRGLQKHRFPELTDRHGLWRLLVSIAIRKLLHARRDQNRIKRGGGVGKFVQSNSNEDGPSALEQIIARELTPELAAQVEEQYECWMNALYNNDLKRITQWKLEGFTNDEIAAKCGLTSRTIERKLNLIRKILVHELTADDARR